MILNAFAILDGFVVAIRGLCSVAVVGLSVCALRSWASNPASIEKRQLLEDHGYLLFLLAFVLLALNVISWPLLYLLLQSYVREWPEVMCIYGVTQIGAGSHGAARFLPSLVESLQWSKPLLVFLTGGWWVLYAINRRTETASLQKRVLVSLVILGTVAVMDVLAETAYLVIPKKEEAAATGCCTGTQALSLPESQLLSETEVGKALSQWLPACYFLMNAGMILALFRSVGWPSTCSRKSLVFLLIGAVASLGVSKIFLREVAAPTLLHLPYHHCVYDLIAQVPESIVGISLFYLGCFAVGWTCVVAWFADRPSTEPIVRQKIQELLLLGLLGYLGSVVMVSIALAIE